MKVSIVTTCRNRIRTLPETVESVLSQDYDDIEYIVTDGASTDGTLEYLESHRDKITQIVSEKDNGIYDGLNKGLRLATGDIVGLLHSDDTYYSTDTISLIVNEFKRTGADLVYANGIFVRAEDTNYVVRDWVSGGYEKGNLRKGWLPLHTTVFIRREVLEKVGYYDVKYHISADTDWLLRALYVNSLKVAYLDAYVVKMKMGGASTSFRTTRQKWGEDLRIYESYGIPQYLSLSLKIAQKIPQFVKARMKHMMNMY